MALFKIFKGDSSLLSSQHIHEGYCYLTTDEKKLYVDISDSQRIVLNSEAASKIQTADGQELSIEEIFENNNNIFIALPNITTPSQVKDALDDGKMIFVRDDNNIYYPLVATAGSGQNITYVFDTLVGNNRSGYNLISNTGEWRSVSTSLATLESPQFSGNPLTPNITSSSSGLQIANKNYVDNANNLFVAIINQTTFEEIRNAYNSGKYIYAKLSATGSIVYTLIQVTNTNAVFGLINLQSAYNFTFYTCSNSGWSYQVVYPVLSVNGIAPSSNGAYGDIHIRNLDVKAAPLNLVFDSKTISSLDGLKAAIREWVSDTSFGIGTNRFYNIVISGTWSPWNSSTGVGLLLSKNSKFTNILFLGHKGKTGNVVNNAVNCMAVYDLESDQLSELQKISGDVSNELTTINNNISNINSGISNINNEISTINTNLNNKVNANQIKTTNSTDNKAIYSATYINSLINRNEPVTAATSKNDSDYIVRGEAIFPQGNYESVQPRKGQIAWFYDDAE